MALLEHSTNSISEQCIGAAIEVHRGLGPGLLESAYHRCLCRELEVRELGFESQVPVCLEYKGVRVERAYCIDIVVEDAVIIETKAVERLLPIHTAQLLTYLRLTGIHCGLLMNFNVDLLTRGIRRVLA